MRPIYTLVLMLAAVFALASIDEAHQVGEQYGVMVWDGTCFAGLEKSQATKLIAPMVDGKADLNHATITGVAVTGFDPHCGHIEIWRKK